jgi:uncharacterized repeat protein (TIGR01451 family)
LNATISGNRASGSDIQAGGGVVIMNDGSGASLTLDNTILAGNGSSDCLLVNSVGLKGAGNLILSNGGCPGVVSTADPQLGGLQLNSPGDTPTMAIQQGSPAADAGDDATALSTDQRGVTRPQGPHSDIGAFEAPPPSADLSLTKAVSVSTAQVGDPVSYTLTLTNAGPNVANSALVTDNLPSAVTFVSCSATGGGVCGGSGNNLTITYATLAVNASATITIQAMLNAGVADGSVVVNSASVSAASPVDPDTSNNSGSASFTVQNNSDLYVFQSATKLTNRQLKYTVNVKNLGKYLAKQLLLTDVVPNGSKFVSITPGAWTCTAPPVGSNGTISCSLSTEAVNVTQSIVFVVKVTTPGNVLVNNTASVSAATFDPNLANNSSTLSSKVGP